jgi:hypothetical protein
MKPKNLILIVILVAVAGFGIWLFMKPAIVVPAKTVDAPIPARTNAAQTVGQTTQVELPKAPAVPAEAETTNSTSPNAESQAELKVVFADIARLYRAGDLVTFTKTYTPPDKLNPQTLQRIEALQQQNQGNQQWVQMYEPQAQAYEDLETQTPTFNAIGDEATYIYTQQPITLPGGGTLGQVKQFPTTFIKMNGKWYRKLGSGN